MLQPPRKSNSTLGVTPALSSPDANSNAPLSLTEANMADIEKANAAASFSKVKKAHFDEEELEQMEKQSNVDTASNYSWNSEDEPPQELGGEVFVCTHDRMVKRQVVQPGEGQTRPGCMDRVCLEWRNDVEWFNLGKNELPCGIECAVRKMRVKEVAKVTYPDFYGQKVSPEAVGESKSGNDKKKFLPGLPRRGETVLNMKEILEKMAEAEIDEDEENDETDLAGQLPEAARHPEATISTIATKESKNERKAPKYEEDKDCGVEEDEEINMITEEIALVALAQIDLLSHDKSVRKETLVSGSAGVARKPREGDEISFSFFDSEDSFRKDKTEENPDLKEPVEKFENIKMTRNWKFGRPLFLILRSMKTNECARIWENGDKEASPAPRFVRLDSFRRHDYVAYSDKIDIPKYEIQAAPKGCMHMKLDDFGLALAAIIVKHEEVDATSTADDANSRNSFWEDEKKNAKIISIRSGDGTVPDVIDTCLKSMAVFEDSVFEVDDLVDMGSDCLYTSLDNMPKTEKSTMKMTSDEIDAIRPALDLTDWLKKEFEETNWPQDEERLYGSAKNYGRANTAAVVL